MPSTREPPQDPFTSSAPLHPTTSNSALRAQSSQQSLRSNASAASVASRTRAGNLFAPALSRRPTTNRSTPGAVLADSDSEAENEPSVQRPRRLRAGVRHGSPEGRGKGKGVGKGMGRDEEVPEFVKRRPDGGFLLGVPGVGQTVAVPVVTVPKTEEEVEQEEVDAHYNAISKQYFASGAALGGRSSKKHEEELEQLRFPMMLRLREQVTERLEGERWQYEPADRFQPVT